LIVYQVFKPQVSNGTKGAYMHVSTPTLKSVIELREKV